MKASATPEADAARWLAASSAVTALTGAGISTDSGIPDFRGPQGVWTRNPGSQALATIDAYISDAEIRRRAWRGRLDNPVWTAQPNGGHRALADLERSGRLRAIITQNIDGLHQAAGTSAERVIEIHGTVHWVMCLSCDFRTPMRTVLARVEAGEQDPQCLECGGVQKSATISFGQALDPNVLAAAVEAAQSCDAFLAIGSSLTVHPAAGLCDYAVGAGARLVVINAQPTPYDAIADAVIRAPIGEVLPQLVAAAAA